MALTFLKERKKRKYFLWIIFGVIIFVAIIYFGKDYLVKPSLSSPPPPKKKTVEINYEALKNPVLGELQPFEEIPSFEGEVGRENPFLPY